MMIDYEKIQRINHFSNFVGCIKKFEAKRIDLLLIVVQCVILILCFMNILLISFGIPNRPLLAFRIVILSSLFIQLLCLIYIFIARIKKKITYGYFYCVGFFGSIISYILTIINFFFTLISCIITAVKIKSYNSKKYDYKSILVIDIFSLLVMIADFFLWYSEILLVYAKTDKNLKEYIEKKRIDIESQNKKIVNVVANEDSNTTKKNINNKNDKIRFTKIKGKIVEEDFVSNNNMEINEKEMNNKIKKEDDLYSVNSK